MAGSWPDVPSRKIAYHVDGTVVAGRYPNDGGSYERFYEWSDTNTAALNDTNHGAVASTWSTGYQAVGYLTTAGQVAGRHVQSVFIFPELRDIYGAIGTFNKGYSSADHGVVDVQTSVDTTNGIDGTWVTHVSWYASSNMLKDPYPEAWRTAIETFSALGVRAVKARANGSLVGGSPLNWRTFYIFGVISAGQTPDRILFVDNNTGLEFTKPMDWGDVPRGTTIDWDIYLLNNSSTLTATTMTLDFTAAYGTTDDWFTISDSGGAFAGTAAVASIGPAARYPAADVFTVRLIVPDTEPLAINEAALELSAAASWT